MARGIFFHPKAPDGFWVSSLAGDDEATCRAYVKSLLHKSSEDLDSQTDDDDGGTDELSSNAWRVSRALELLGKAQPIDGTLGAKYLKAWNCYPSDPTYLDDLRYHPCCPFGELLAPALIMHLESSYSCTPPHKLYRWRSRLFHALPTN